MKIQTFMFLFLAATTLQAQVTHERMLHADREPQNWLTYSGGYASMRYSELTQIDRGNVKGLQLKWVHVFDSPKKI